MKLRSWFRPADRNPAAHTSNAPRTGGEVQPAERAEVTAELPKLLFPPNWPVIGSAVEAREHYRDWELVIGETVSGPVTVSLWRSAHIMCVGESGSGRQVIARSWLEQFRAAGWQLILADGKGPDYAGYFAPSPEDNNLPVPGTVAVSTATTLRAMTYAAAITLAYQIMKERQQGAVEAKIANPSGWNNFAPVLLVLDEIKAVREKWKSTLSNAEADRIESMVTQILALGRELRVHVILFSQDARATSIPNTWKSQVATTVCLGRPSELTLKYVFVDGARHVAQTIADAMDRTVRGRGIISRVDDNTGIALVDEFQGYLSYAPGESWHNVNLPPPVKEHWPSFKENVSDAVPRMYTRQWFRIEEKSDAQLDAEAKSGEERGYIDFDMFTVEEIQELPRVALDIRTPDGRVIANPEVSRFDPLSVDYVCRPPDHPGNSVREEV
ncbi:hypothetical protein [Mycolicibacterium conceptionense]|uniref:hypothetical protein n=1 Tax=Mycolicibacterium conceptionense TaxID=451644 RepID=UPI00069F35F7|nr:hypothetical protein [Mycolicibacterium conceptionense]